MSLISSPAWRALLTHAATADTPVKTLLGDDARTQALTHALDGVAYDFTRSTVSLPTLSLLFDLANQQQVATQLRGMMDGAIVNLSEHRAALHTSLRAPDAPAEVSEALARIKALADTTRSDTCIETILHIGIGGSDIGPRMVCHALAKAAPGPRVIFSANADGDDILSALAQCNPKTTLVVVASKTFSTQETLLNLRTARDWACPTTRIVAVTANTKAAIAEGVAPGDILPMWDWVGGRYSVWSCVGVTVALAFGFDVFTQFLAGAHIADRHAYEAPVHANIPILQALLALWYRNFRGYGVHAVLPYVHELGLMPVWVQQLEMESNGKGVDRDGRPCDYDTGPVMFGGPGTLVQHSLMQLVQQGTSVIPCDFIGVRDGQPHGDVMRANMHAQIDALSFGGGSTPYSVLPGNRPATAIMLARLDARHLGTLMALWEHKTACLGFLWNINSFDQFGVELGKTLAKERLAREA